MCKAQRRQESKDRQTESRLLDFEQARTLKRINNVARHDPVWPDEKLVNLPSAGHAGAKEVFRIMEKIL
jgi:hypothetical protein